MAILKSSTMTGAPAKQIHAGLNCVVADYLLQTTSVAADVIQMCQLPAGAQVVSTKLIQTSGSIHGGMIVTDGESNSYMVTATGTLNIASVGSGNGFGNRLTGDSHMQVTFSGITAAIPSASGNLRLIVQYLSDKAGD